MLHRPGLAGDPIAQRPGPGAGDGGILDFDGQVAVAIALGVAVPVPVVGQLQGSGSALVLVADEGLNDFWRARLWSELLLLDETRRARVLPYVHAWAQGGARVSGVDAVRGFNQTFEMRRRAARLFGEIDLLLTPTNQVEAFPADWASPLNDPQRPFEHIVFTVPWNMGEQPALSINCGFTAAGMPIGLQLVAPRFADTWLLRIGKTYEGWRGPIHGWPRPPAD